MDEDQQICPRPYGPGDAVVLVALARAYQVSGRTVEAQAAARRARAVAPAYAAGLLAPFGL